MADIALHAGMPKSNLHYYFRTKQALYRAVLAHTLQLWLSETDIISADHAPRVALEQYIRAKMRLSASHPDASRVFANELLHGAPEIGGVLREALRELVTRKAMVIRSWIEDGQMARVDPITSSSRSGPPRRPTRTSMRRSAPYWASASSTPRTSNAPPSTWWRCCCVAAGWIRKPRWPDPASCVAVAMQSSSTIDTSPPSGSQGTPHVRHHPAPLQYA
jgi:AcrR family transcriptional regulator